MVLLETNNRTKSTNDLRGPDFDCLQTVRDISPLVLGRALKLCNFLDYQDIKASLYRAITRSSIS